MNKSQRAPRPSSVFTERNKPFVPLNTSGAFHSRYMREAKQQFDAVLADTGFAAPALPVISNYTGKPYGPGEVLVNLSNQLSSPVLWAEGVEYLLGLGDMTFEEIGDSKALTNLVARIKKAPRAARRPAPVAVDDPATAGQAARSPLGAAERIRRWNARYCIGTKVRSQVVEGPVLVTRSEAVVLFGHRAAVYLEGYQGYFDLDEVTALE